MLMRWNNEYKIKNIRINGQHESFSNFSEHKHTIPNKKENTNNLLISCIYIFVRNIVGLK